MATLIAIADSDVVARLRLLRALRDIGFLAKQVESVTA
jgi:hypothetical protein